MSRATLHACRLARGHCYSALLVDHLPCSSSSTGAGGGVGGGPVNTSTSSTPSSTTGKQFIVLASYLMYQGPDPMFEFESGGGGEGGSGPAHTAAGPSAPSQGGAARVPQQQQQQQRGGESVVPAGVQQLRGLLSVFEVVVERVPGSLEARYSLLLHGVQVIGSVATSLGTAVPGAPTHVDPKASAAGGGQQAGGKGAEGSSEHAAAGTASTSTAGGEGHDGQHTHAHLQPAQQPHLVAGCHNGVHVYQVHVDDTGSAGRDVITNALKAIESVEPLPSFAPPPQSLFGGKCSISHTTACTCPPLLLPSFAPPPAMHVLY